MEKTGKRHTNPDLEIMARFYLSLMEGNTHDVEEAYAFMYKHGFVDKDGFEIYPEDE